MDSVLIQKQNCIIFFTARCYA